jgi:hypothetical protein
VSNSTELLANELKKYRCICFYPSSGADLSDLDFFASGQRPLFERLGETAPGAPEPKDPELPADLDPDLFIHTDLNFYQEFAAGKDLEADECGIHGDYEIIGFRELPGPGNPNRISSNYDFSGQCFEYKFRLWNSEKVRTLLICLCENEFFVARILLAHKINSTYIWSRNWNGGQTYGTWMANVLDQLHTKKMYTDWLCIPGQRGEPRNRLVEEKYPELMGPVKIRLVRNNELRWIDEGAHGWVEEFDIEPAEI